MFLFLIFSSEKDSNYLEKYWFDAANNSLFHPNCTDKKFKKNKFCGNLTYLNTACSYAPIQLLRINSEIFHSLNFGRLIYDPWSSETLKIIFMVRDPRGIVYERIRKSKCSGNSCAPEKICTRMRVNLRAILQYQTFSSTKAK